jgi:fumarate reductase subunit D
VADQTPKPTPVAQPEIGEVIDLVKTYVRQETVGPLKGLGRKVGIGVAGAIMLGMGLFFLALGLLRLIQDKAPRLASGALSWISYVIVIVFCVILAFVALSRIKKIEKELN